jgi:hypothetical protein
MTGRLTIVSFDELFSEAWSKFLSFGPNNNMLRDSGNDYYDSPQTSLYLIKC